MTEEHLTPALLDLMDHEKAIEEHLDGIGWNLERIRDGRKYRAAGYATFEAYCAGRWHKSRHWGYQMIAAAQVEQLSATADNGPAALAPTSEWQVRPLTPLRDDPEVMRAAWDNAVDEAGGQPTAEQVADVVHQLRNCSRCTSRTGAAVPIPPCTPPTSCGPSPSSPTVTDAFSIPSPVPGRSTSCANTDTALSASRSSRAWAAMHEGTQCGSAVGARLA